MLRYFFCLLALPVLLSCSGRKSAPATAPEKVPPRLFRVVAPPGAMDDAQRYAYLREHFWDDLDFADTVFIVSTDTIHMLRAFDTYIWNFVMESDPSPVAELMRKASGSKTMLEYFAMLAERVLHDPNSPLHSDELYIPVLEALVASPWLDEWEKIAPEHDLRMALQNRVGLPANDFRYTLASGRTGTLYGIRADYTLVFFNNPDCGMCERIRAEIVASPLLSEMIRAGRLEVLALYPDEDLTAWRAHAPQVPSLWINAYDAGARISKEELYDLKAIPSMYLLDRDKRVLAKDAFEVGYIEWLLDRQPQ